MKRNIGMLSCWIAVLGCVVGAEPEQSVLLDVLREKGVLSNAEVERIVSVQPEAKYPQFKMGGRIMMDVAGYDSDDADFSSGTEFRRARFFLKGRAAPDWFYKLQYELNGEGAEGFQDAYFGYDGWDGNATLRMGQMIEAGSLEDTSSSKYITFMERALPVLAFSPATRRIGVRVDSHGEWWHAAGGVFGGVAADDETEDDTLGGSVRMTCAPWRATGRVVHLGASGQYRVPREDTMRFRARPESHVDDTRLVDTGSMTNVNHYVTAGLEAALVHGPLSFQGEYIGVNVDRDDGDSLFLDGFYLYASWLITGESRSYDATLGEFVRLKPAKPFGDAGLGAWEVAVRYSELDLDDEVRGGRERNVTAGINWYVNKRIRFMLNLIRAESEKDTGDVDVDIAQLRAQIDF
ncbi:MAG: porin [Kiritimatiellae bacterium]|nr:porin [Kiritimatiellia bacterium]